MNIFLGVIMFILKIFRGILFLVSFRGFFVDYQKKKERYFCHYRDFQDISIILKVARDILEV